MTQTAPAPTAPKPAATVTCRVPLLSDTYPHLTFSAGVSALAGPIRVRESQLGPDTLRTAAARAGYAALPAAQKYATLIGQVRAAEAKLADAEHTFERVRAAELLLQDNPSGDFANDLRRVAAEVEDARRAKASAEADLALIRVPVSKLYAAAANAVTDSVRHDAFSLGRSLDPVEKAAGAALTEACQRVAEITRAAVEEYLIPLLIEQRATARACGEAHTAGRAVASETVRAVLGIAPRNVVLKENVYQIVLVEPEPEPEPETIMEPIPWPGP